MREQEEMQEKELGAEYGSFTRFPDLIMMDGGRGQVNICLKVLDELHLNIPVCGMVKDDNHNTRGLYYQNERWGLMSSLLYNRLGKRIIGIGKSNSTTHDVSVNIPDTYELPRNSLDFTVSKKFGKLVELKAGVKDIIGEKVVYKQYPQFYDAEGKLQKREQTTKSYKPGRSVSVGITFSF